MGAPAASCSKASAEPARRAEQSREKPQAARWLHSSPEQQLQTAGAWFFSHNAPPPAASGHLRSSSSSEETPDSQPTTPAEIYELGGAHVATEARAP